MGFARQHPLLIATVVLVVGGAVAAGVVVARTSSHPFPAAVLADCGHPVSGQGFHVYACMSGGAAAGYPHPKELLVIRSDGSSVAYPAFRISGVAAADGKVVAVYDINLVQVTSRRLVPLVTQKEAASVLRTRSTAIMDLYDPRLDARGDVYVIASMVHRPGCRNRLLERTTGGAIRQLRSSVLARNTICS